MINKFILEVWDPLLKHYRKTWEGDSFERAEIMFKKPYYSLHTRRLLKVTIEELYKEKGKK